MKDKKICENMKKRRDEREKQALIIKHKLDHIRNKILVMSGKGGVGKSSVAVCLSTVLAKRGFHVGLMDIDLHGPGVPLLLDIKERIRMADRMTLGCVRSDAFPIWR